MRSVNISELKDHLSTYLTYATAGEEVVISDHDRPVAKLVRYASDDLSEEDLALVAAGKMVLPKEPFDVDEFLAMPEADIDDESLLSALLEERAESR